MCRTIFDAYVNRLKVNKFSFYLYLIKIEWLGGLGV